MPRPAKRDVPPTKGDLARSVSHHVDTLAYELSHAKRHVDEAARARTPAARRFNADHATAHMARAVAKARSLTGRVRRVPAVGAETKKLDAARKRVKGK